MQIESVAIRRYRAFDQRTVVPLRPLSVLTGPNNLGKSTVLSALHLFFSVLSPERPTGSARRNRYRHEDDYPKKYTGRAGRRWPTQIVVAFGLSEADSNAILEGLEDEEPLERVEVSVEFAWDERFVEFRPKIRILDIESQPARQAFERWLRNDVRYVYIPAARNVQDFRRNVFSELIEGALARVTRSRQRLQALERLLEDVKQEVAAVEVELANELRQYLPDVRSLNFSLTPFGLDQLVSVRDLDIDDGANTPLSQKGDGFKSLFSISLLQYLARRRYGKNLVFAIEEPEAHLHSSAIYEIKDTLRRLSDPFQVLITTHSPILIQRDDLSANIIVQRIDGNDFSTTAQPARSLAELRRSLGVRLHENMATAEVVVVVEGLTEERTLPSLLSRCDPALRDAYAAGRVRVIGAGGGSSIPSVVRALARDATNCITLADSDNEGQQAYQRLRASGFMLPVDIFSVPPRHGCVETEYEDLFEPNLYLPSLAQDVGIALTSEEFAQLKLRTGGRHNRCAKWSEVMRIAAQEAGQDWDAISTSAKTSVAGAIASATERGEIEPGPWARAIAARVLAYLQE